MSFVDNRNSNSRVLSMLVLCIIALQVLVAIDARANAVGNSSNLFTQSFKFNVGKFHSALNSISDNINPRFELQLSDGNKIEIDLYRRINSGAGTVTLTGALVGQPGSQVRLSLEKSGELHGQITVHKPDGNRDAYLISHRNAGHYEFQSIRTQPSANAPDPATMESMRSSLVDDAVGSSAFSVSARRDDTKHKPVVGDPDNGDTIDLLVVYTPAAQAYIGSKAGIEEAIRRNVRRTNFAFVDSGINTQIRLLDMRRVGGFREGRVRFRQLATVGDGVMDVLPAMRDKYAADLVMVISEVVNDARGTSVCGQAAIPNLARDPKGDFAGYSWVSAYCLEGAVVFAHELGHNLNAQHQRSDPDVYGANKPQRSNFAYMARSRKYRTIMDTAANCLAQTCPSIRFFSTPRVRPYANRIGLPNADNARAINQFRSKVAAYRVTRKVEEPTVWLRSDTGTLDRTNPVVHFSANGTAVQAWRVYLTEYASGVGVSNFEIYPAATQKIKLDLLSVVHAASPEVELQVDYRKDGRWFQGQSTTVIVRGPDEIRIDDEILWLQDVLRGWFEFVSPRSNSVKLQSSLASLRRFVRRKNEKAAERVINEIRQRTDGCRQRANSAIESRPDGNDWVTSCWAQQELQLGLNTIGHHVNTLEKNGYIRGWRGRCLQVKSRNSSAVVIEDCSTQPISEQTWELTEEGKLISGGRCLDTGTLDSISGRNVRMAACVNEDIDQQRWFFDDDRLVSATSPDGCLTVEGPHPRAGIAIETNQCVNDVEWQKWTLSEN